MRVLKIFCKRFIDTGSRETEKRETERVGRRETERENATTTP